jgi:hypothetical protein
VALWATAERPDAAQNSERQATTQKRRILRVTCFSRFCAGPPPPAAAAWLVCVSCSKSELLLVSQDSVCGCAAP